jgi:hypothetical protein
MNEAETNASKILGFDPKQIFDENVYNIPKNQSDLLFYISIFIAVSAAYAFSKKQYDLFVLSTFALITSLNHWRDPQIGIRRNIDLAIIWFGAIYIFLRAMILQIYSISFWIFYIAALLSFVFGWRLFLNGYIWHSTIMHCILHICTNLSIILMC